MMNPIKLKEEMSPGRRKSKTKEGLEDRMETETLADTEEQKVDDEQTCSWEIGACF